MPMNVITDKILVHSLYKKPIWTIWTFISGKLIVEMIEYKPRLQRHSNCIWLPSTCLRNAVTVFCTNLVVVISPGLKLPWHLGSFSLQNGCFTYLLKNVLKNLPLPLNKQTNKKDGDKRFLFLSLFQLRISVVLQKQEEASVLEYCKFYQELTCTNSSILFLIYYGNVCCN